MVVVLKIIGACSAISNISKISHLPILENTIYREGDMQKKLLKQLSIFLGVFFLIFITITTPVQSYAKEKNVTDSISSHDKKNIKKLAKCFSTPCGYDLTERGMVEGETIGYKFSKASTRQHIIKLSWEEIEDQNISKNELSKRLFGVSTPNIKLLIGQWGSSGPIIKIKYIYKISSYKYKIKTNLVWYDPIENTKTKVGEVDFTLKKKQNTYYGYIVKSLNITKT